MAPIDLSGKTLPPYGYLLVTNSGGYSLGNDYAATYTTGTTTVTSYATGDVTYTGDILSTSTITLKNASGTPIDSVGDVWSILSPASPSNQYSYVRRMDGPRMADTDNDIYDFNLVDTSSTNGTPNFFGISTLTGGARLGAPGPQNTSSPRGIQTISFAVLNPNDAGGLGSAGRYVSRGSSADPLGRLSLRHTITNTSSSTITQLRFVLVRSTSGSSSNADLADLRALSSNGVSLNGVKYVQGLQVESPTIPTTFGAGLTSASVGTGGGINSSWNVGTLPPGGLAPGASMNIEFLFGIVKEGTYNFAVVAQVIRDDFSTPTPVPTPTVTPTPIPSLDASIHADTDTGTQWTGVGTINADATGQDVLQHALPGMTSSYTVSVRHIDPATSGPVRLSVPSYAAFATGGWSARFFVGTSSQEITSALTSSAGWSTTVAAGGEVRVRVELLVPSGASPNSSRSLLVQAQDASGASPPPLDCVSASVLVDAAPSGPYLKSIEWSTDGSTWHTGSPSTPLLQGQSLGLRAIAYDPQSQPWHKSLDYMPTWSVTQAGHAGSTSHLGPVIWVQGESVGTLSFSVSGGRSLSGSATIVPDPDDEEDTTP